MASSVERKLLVCIVLYQMQAQESPAFLGIAASASENPEVASAIKLVVLDNSSDRHEPPSGFTGVFLQDMRNPGLAERYNQALKIATAEGFEWLLLLDQDTLVTRNFLREVLETMVAVQGEKEIFVLAPKLLQRGELLSPRLHATIRFDKPPDVRIEEYGPTSRRLQVYNSGAVLRTSAVTAIGGFPEEFPLDALDHATIHKLQAQGGRIFLLHSLLEHELSVHPETFSSADEVSQRSLSALRAAKKFYFRYGTPGERLHFCLHMARLIGGALRHGRKHNVKAYVGVLTHR